MGDEEPSELPAGVPSARSNRVIMFVATGFLALVFFGFIGVVSYDSCANRFADNIGRIDVTEIGAPHELPLSLPAARTLSFAVASTYAYSGHFAVLLQVALLRDGVQVAETECKMTSSTGVNPSGSGHRVWYGDAGWPCTLEVPGGGATAVRATVKKRGEGTLTLSDTSVLVNQR